MQLFCLGILVTKQPIRSFIFFNGGKTANRGIESIVGVVIVALGHFTQQHGSCALLYREIVVEELLNVNALTGR